MQTGRFNESFDDTMGYKIRVCLLDKLGQGVDGKEISISSNKGAIVYQDQYTREINNRHGIAEAIIKFDTYSDPQNVFDYHIEVTCEDAQNTLAR